MEFRILGPLEVVVEDQVLPLGGAKQRALLAILLMNANRVVSTDRLIDDLWGEEPPATAANIVQVYVSQVRKILRGAGDDNEILVTQRPGYVLRVASEELDLHRFERLCEEGRHALVADDPSVASVKLRSALALFRGQPLNEFAFEAFARPDIERVEEARLAALEDRIEADLRLGRHVELVGEVEALVREHPLRERFREQLMLALYRSGRQAEALQGYHGAMEALGEELGIDPSPALQRLHEAILRQEPALEAPRPVAARLPAKAEEAFPRPSTPTPIEATERPIPLRDQGVTELGDQLLPVMVLFSDIVGSTALAERLSADEVRALIGECVSRMTRAVEAAGGSVQAYLGDGICACFGVPVPHEDDPERAASTALGIVRIVREYAQEIEVAWGISGFDVRVGLNSGRAVVGVVGADAPEEIAFGDATNVGAALKTAAAPGTIVVGDSFAQRIGGDFALEPIGPLEIKDRSEPVLAWRLEGRRSSVQAPAATPLVGRTPELAQLEAVAGDLIAGRGQVLLLDGEVGLGKTRLLSELRALVGGSTGWLEGRCRSYEGQSPFWPFVDALRVWFGVAEGEPELAARTRMVARLSTVLAETRVREIQPYLGRLLGIRMDPASESTLAALSAEALQGQIRVAFVELIEALAQRSAVVLAIDDLNDADASTLELFTDLLPLTDRVPVLVAAATRTAPGSEVWRLWVHIQGGFRHRLVEIRLAPLSDEAAGDLADALAPIGSLDVATKSEIVARAEGNPLYVEELVRLLSESGGFERGRSGSITHSRSTILLPPALEGLLVARVQQLPAPARRLAQIAAVMGRTFPVAVLRVVADTDGFDAAFADLLRAEVVRENQRYPEFECSFRHGLLRDGVLSTLTPAKAKEVHLQVARGYEIVYADSLEAHLDRLALLCSRGGDLPKALSYLERAGRRARELKAMAQAEHLLTHAQQVAAKLRDADAERRLEVLLASTRDE